MPELARPLTGARLRRLAAAKSARKILDTTRRVKAGAQRDEFFPWRS